MNVLTATPETDKYIDGSIALNNLFDMMHMALLASMPGVQISGSGAYVWRGYRIDKYNDFPKGLFYLQISPSNPNYLIFKESYKYPPYKALDSRDEHQKGEYRIKDGQYYHPFGVTLNLYLARFFLLSPVEQYDLIRNFVSYASEQALIWQKSQARARPNVTHKQFLHGNLGIKQNRLKAPASYGAVSLNYLTVFTQQDELFEKLKQAIYNKLGGNYVVLVPNAHWTHWHFRGYRLGIESRHADFWWKIHYTAFDKLECYEANGKKRKAVFDIRGENYFDRDAKNQDALLAKFVEQCLQ